MRAIFILISAQVALAACVPFGNQPDPAFEGMPVPEGTTVFRGDVDQMIVGDRLMASGEYDLALRAYIRDAAVDGFTPTHMVAMGSANLALGRLGQAEDLLRDAAELTPEEPVAWNNLGVVLMEQGNYGEARQVFQRAFALDSGQTDSIRENLRLAIARMENTAYTPPENDNRYGLERRGGGRYLLIDEFIP